MCYKTIVRPKVEYAASIWDPWEKANIQRVESVQRAAARFIKNQPHRCSDKGQVSVSQLIEDLGWRSLQERRKRGCLTFLYHMRNGLVEIPAEYLPSLAGHTYNTRRSTPSHHYQHYSPTVDVFKYALLPDTVPRWNSLPTEVASAPSLDSLRPTWSPPISSFKFTTSTVPVYSHCRPIYMHVTFHFYSPLNFNLHLKA